MMTWLRKHNREIMIMTFATFLIGSVAFTGAQTFALTPLSAALVVNGDKIPYKRYQTALSNRISREQGEMNPEKATALKNTTIQELVQETAILQEAERYGIVATNEEVAAFIRSVPAFQTEGRFNPNLYIQFVQQNMRMTPREFEEDRRRDIRRQKLMMLLSSAVRISDAEVQDRLARLPAAGRKQFEGKPEELRNAIAQEQGNAVFQAWIQQLNQKLKVESKLDRWEKQEQP